MPMAPDGNGWLLLLAGNTVKGALLFAAAYAVTYRFRRSPAAWRHAVWAAAAFGTLPLPLISLLLPAWEAGPAPGFAVRWVAGPAGAEELPAGCRRRWW